MDVRACGSVHDPRQRFLRPALVCLIAATLGACSGLNFSLLSGGGDLPPTVSRALGKTDSTRDASLRLVIAGLDDDTAGRPSRALASYQRAVRVDSTNPFAFLALARHHLDAGSIEEASAFLDQSRSLFEREQALADAVDVWRIGLRAGIDREMGRHEMADLRFEAARELSPEIWSDERLSAAELR